MGYGGRWWVDGGGFRAVDIPVAKNTLGNTPNKLLVIFLTSC